MNSPKGSRVFFVCYFHGYWERKPNSFSFHILEKKSVVSNRPLGISGAAPNLSFLPPIISFSKSGLNELSRRIELNARTRNL